MAMLYLSIGEVMCKIAKIALGVVAVGAVACAIVHRRVIVATIKGEPLPEMPESHKAWHPCAQS